ncbi:hypothetical protein [Burkholderia sp. LMU1-1-1.1]|uniref:hypothetical protein n=1 Tax=Burkholderia sp. LMU1-1-1.1 TaxID=3135266 RepID=UPI003424B149
METRDAAPETMLEPYPFEASARDRLFIVWSRLIEWGLNHSMARKALRQLKVSDRVTVQSRQRCHAMFLDSRSMVEQCLAGHAALERISFYIDTILFALADITMNAIASKPKEREAIQQSRLTLELSIWAILSW